MKYIDSYNNLKIEKSILNERLNYITNYINQLNEEGELLKKLIKINEKTINKIEIELKELNGIENKLYYEIVVNGTNVSKAIEKVAEIFDMDVSTLWKNYYPKVKNRIVDLKESEKGGKNETNRNSW